MNYSSRITHYALISALAFPLAAFLWFCILLASCAESLEDRACREAKEFTKKNCPVPITRELALDSITFNKNTLTLTSYYSISPKAEIEEIDVDRTSNALLTELKNNTGQILYKKAGYNFRYIYYKCGKENKHLLDVTFKQKDYR